jgi:voltage-gated potassium channel
VANAFANQLARRRAIFEAELRQGLQNGELHEDEIARLEQMKKTFKLSDKQAQNTMANVEMAGRNTPADAPTKTAP